MEQSKQKIRLSKRHASGGMEMKPDTLMTGILDLPNEEEQEQERVSEKLSISVPTQPLQRPTGVLAYAGQRVRLLLRDGNVVVGFLQKRLWNYLHLLNIEETGRDYKLAADWCDVEIGTIARVYPASAKVEQISKP